MEGVIGSIPIPPTISSAPNGALEMVPVARRDLRAGAAGKTLADIPVQLRFHALIPDHAATFLHA
jgi:hypothetical protein